MNKRVVVRFFLILNSFLLTSCLTVGAKQAVDDPSVTDQNDIDVIDEYLQSEKDNSNGSGQNSNRGSLTGTHAATTTDNALSSTGTGVTDQTIRKNEKGEPCRCVQYLLCKFAVKETTTTTTTVVTQTAEAPTSATTTEDEEANAGTESSQNIADMADPRLNDLTNNNYTCPGDSLDVCCPLKDIKEEGSITTTSTTSTTTTTTTTTTTPSPPKSTESGRHHCGHRNENGVGQQVPVGAQEAKFGEFPWTAAIVHEEKNEDNFTVLKYLGGGSLLHPQVVLTVAHNVLGKSRANLKVRLGEWDTQSNDEPFPSQDRGVKKVIIHELFLKKTLYNDVALLILDEEVRLAPNVDTICLPPLPKKGKQPLSFDGQLCYSGSWGMDQFGLEGRYSDIMKKVTIPVVSHDKCQKELQKSEKLPSFRLDKSFMCAGGSESGEDTCKGDGGSALACSVRGGEYGSEDGQVHYVQVGAVSWGLGCKSTVYPGVYADIQRLTPWILKTMEKEEMSTEYCTFT